MQSSTDENVNPKLLNTHESSTDENTHESSTDENVNPKLLKTHESSTDENMNPKLPNINESSTDEIINPKLPNTNESLKLDNSDHKESNNIIHDINKSTTHDNNINKTIILRKLSINDPCLNDNAKNVIVSNNSLFDEITKKILLISILIVIICMIVILLRYYLHKRTINDQYKIIYYIIPYQNNS